MPYLDGAKLLKATLEMVFGDTASPLHDYDVEAFDLPPSQRLLSRRHIQSKEMLDRFIPRFTTVVFALCTLLGIINVSW